MQICPCGSLLSDDIFKTIRCNKINTINFKGCREEILFYFKRNYVDFLIGGFGLVCTLLLEIFAFISCFCIRKNLLLNYRADDDNNQNVIIQLSSNSKNIA